jgi:hypothetical protein
VRENREASIMPELKFDTGRSVKAISRKTVMHVMEDSDSGIVPMNQPNNVGRRPMAEVGEGRPGAKENSPPSHLPPTRSGTRRSQGWWGYVKQQDGNPRSASLPYFTLSQFRCSGTASTD